MLIKIFLVLILFSPTGEGYMDVVLSFDTPEQCEKERTAAIAHFRRVEPTGSYFATCTKPRAFSAVDA